MPENMHPKRLADFGLGCHVEWLAYIIQAIRVRVVCVRVRCVCVCGWVCVWLFREYLYAFMSDGWAYGSDLVESKSDLCVFICVCVYCAKSWVIHTCMNACMQASKRRECAWENAGSCILKYIHRRRQMFPYMSTYRIMQCACSVHTKHELQLAKREREEDSQGCQHGVTARLQVWMAQTCFVQGLHLLYWIVHMYACILLSCADTRETQLLKPWCCQNYHSWLEWCRQNMPTEMRR